MPHNQELCPPFIGFDKRRVIVLKLLGDGLLIQIGHKSLQTLLNVFLVVKSATQNSRFELLVNNRLDLGSAAKVTVKAASIQKCLTSLTCCYAVADRQ